MMTADHRQNYLENLRAGLSVLVYPVQYVVSFPFSAGNWLGENLSSRDTLLANNDQLKKQNDFLKAQMQKFISLELENMRLRKLLEASEKVTDRILAAELLAIDFDPFSHKVMINKGARHEVYADQPVIDADGVFGQTIHITPLTSSVMLITDPSHSLPVQFNRTGLRSIAAGTGKMGTLELLHIPNNADIKVGDMIVTSGLGGVFPTGYPVAEVTSFTPQPSKPYAQVTGKPLASLDRSREVLLVWHKTVLQDQQAAAPSNSEQDEKP